MAPGRPQGVQQTILAFGVLRGMTVMLAVGFGYPSSTYAPCLFIFRAMADEESEMPRAQISNPSMTDVLLLLAMTMEFLHRLLSAPGNYGACCLAKPAEILARSESNPGPVKIFPLAPRADIRPMQRGMARSRSPSAPPATHPGAQRGAA